jgi:hypothetical protein
MGKIKEMQSEQKYTNFLYVFIPVVDASDPYGKLGVLKILFAFVQWRPPDRAVCLCLAPVVFILPLGSLFWRCCTALSWIHVRQNDSLNPSHIFCTPYLKILSERERCFRSELVYDLSLASRGKCVLHFCSFPF